MLRKGIANGGRVPVFRRRDAIRRAPPGGGELGGGGGGWGWVVVAKRAREKRTAGLIGAPVFVTASRCHRHHGY